MDSKDKKIIVDYLKGPRNYAEGVRLYDRYGHNRMFKRRFALENSELSRSILFEELRKLAGLSEQQFRQLPRLARRSSNSAPAVNGIELKIIIEEEPKRRELPESIKKTISLREKYPFLNDYDCPEELKVLVADMITAHSKYVEAFNRLQELPDAAIEKAMIEAQAVVENYINNREIWEVLDYYKEHGELLGKATALKSAPEEEYSALTDLELSKKLMSARSNLSKQEKALAKARDAGGDISKLQEKVARWSETKKRIETEIEIRKKK